jgi:hypothetical protein
LQIVHLRYECQFCMMRNKKLCCIANYSVIHRHLHVQPTNIAGWWSKNDCPQ